MLLDLSEAALIGLAANLRHCRTLSEAETYLQDALPNINPLKAWGIWDGFSGRPTSENHDWSMAQRREYRSGVALGREIYS